MYLLNSVWEKKITESVKLKMLNSTEPINNMNKKCKLLFHSADNHKRCSTHLSRGNIYIYIYI